MALETIINDAPVALYLGDDTAEAHRQAAAAAASASAAALSETAALAAARYYSTIAAGVSATTTGQLFTSDEGGTWNYYLRTGTTPFYSLYREVLSYDGSGNLGLGTASPTKRLEVRGAGTNAAVRLRETASYNVSWDINVGAANEMQFTHNGASSLDYIFRSGRLCLIDDFSFGVRWSMDVVSANELRFSNNAGGPLEYVFNNGHVRPGTDNNRTLGSASYRWSVVYAGTGTINTSDAREKVWRGAMTAAELAAAKRIVAELGFYQWVDAVAEKGADGARYHFGARAQAVWAIMADEGLVDPIGRNGKPGATPYAFLCFDEWDKGAAGSRFGLRLDQLTLFLIAAQEARLAALEAA